MPPCRESARNHLQSGNAITARAFAGNQQCQCAEIQKAADHFTVVFYGLKILCRKTAQLSVTQRKCRMAEAPSVSNAVQRSENPRKNSFLNYKSAALSG
jgi:hypothetical protein